MRCWIFRSCTSFKPKTETAHRSKTVHLERGKFKHFQAVLRSSRDTIQQIFSYFQQVNVCQDPSAVVPKIIRLFDLKHVSVLVESQKKQQNIYISFGVHLQCDEVMQIWSQILKHGHNSKLFQFSMKHFMHNCFKSRNKCLHFV